MDDTYNYAGFWRRFVALIIDSFIVGIATFIIVSILGGILAGTGHLFGDDSVAGSIMIAFTVVTVVPLYLLGPTLYFALFESSEFQATPGKMVLSLRVVDVEGQRISFWRSVGRNLGKIVSGMILYIGFAMAGWTQRKQALHDMMADCLVIRSID